METVENRLGECIIRTLLCGNCRREFLDGDEFYDLVKLEYEQGRARSLSDAFKKDDP
jgi:hypothetical protein